MILPKSKDEDIIVQNAGNELLVYDLKTNKVFNLNETARIVFEACDGHTSFDELKRKHRFTDDIIYFALDELKHENLITAEYKSALAGTSRREVIKKIGLATMIVLPIIVGVTAPSAVQAQSCHACYSATTVPKQCLPPVNPNAIATCIPYCAGICCGTSAGVDVSINAGGCTCNNVICA